MDTQAIIAAIDSEISNLQKASAVLNGVIKASAAAPASKPSRRRQLSKAARERMAAGQRKRWAAA
jgi:hypothetical protein